LGGRLSSFEPAPIIVMSVRRLTCRTSDCVVVLSGLRVNVAFWYYCFLWLTPGNTHQKRITVDCGLLRQNIGVPRPHFLVMFNPFVNHNSDQRCGMK